MLFIYIYNDIKLFKEQISNEIEDKLINNTNKLVGTINSNVGKYVNEIKNISTNNLHQLRKINLLNKQNVKRQMVNHYTESEKNDLNNNIFMKKDDGNYYMSDGSYTNNNETIDQDKTNDSRNNSKIFTNGTYGSILSNISYNGDITIPVYKSIKKNKDTNQNLQANQMAKHTQEENKETKEHHYGDNITDDNKGVKNNDNSLGSSDKISQDNLSQLNNKILNENNINSSTISNLEQFYEIGTEYKSIPIYKSSNWKNMITKRNNKIDKNSPYTLEKLDNQENECVLENNCVSEDDVEILSDNYNYLDIKLSGKHEKKNNYMYKFDTETSKADIKSSEVMKISTSNVTINLNESLKKTIDGKNNTNFDIPSTVVINGQNLNSEVTQQLDNDVCVYLNNENIYVDTINKEVKKDIVNNMLDNSYQKFINNQLNSSILDSHEFEMGDSSNDIDTMLNHPMNIMMNHINDPNLKYSYNGISSKISKDNMLKNINTFTFIQNISNVIDDHPLYKSPVQNNIVEIEEIISEDEIDKPDEIDEQVEGEIDEQVEDEIDEQVEGEIDEQVEGEIDGQVEDETDEQAKGEIDEQVEDETDERAEGEINEQAEDETYEQVEDEIGDNGISDSESKALSFSEQIKKIKGRNNNIISVDDDEIKSQISMISIITEGSIRRSKNKTNLDIYTDLINKGKKKSVIKILDDFKFVELKKIAKDLDINLTYKDNGKSKQYKKDELYDKIKTLLSK